jgi:chromosome partitioning protein
MRMDDYSPYLTRTLLVGNRKGGVLKSSIVRSVADEAVRLGYKVLVLDGDPQGNLSKINFGLGEVEVGGWESDRGRSLAMAMQYGTEMAPMHAHGVDVVCGGPELMGVLGAAIANPSVNLSGNLRASLARLCAQGQYDLVLIDSGPGDTNLLDAYMLTAKWLVVPVVDGDENSMDGLDKMGARYVDLRSKGAEIEVLGAVLTLIDHTAKSRNKVNWQILQDALGDVGDAFETMIRDSKAARSDTTRYGLSAGQVAEKSVDVRKSRIAALRQRAKEAKADGPGKHKAVPTTKLENPDEPWFTRDGSGLAEDYAKLTREIVARIGKRLAADVA